MSDEIRLWVVRRSQTRRTNTNEQDTYITVCKILNTKNTETQTDKITHVINHVRTCRKKISAKLRTADIFAILKVFLKTFPTKMKPTKCPAREKLMRQKKRKRGDGRKRKVQCRPEPSELKYTRNMRQERRVNCVRLDASVRLS